MLGAPLSNSSIRRRSSRSSSSMSLFLLALGRRFASAAYVSSKVVLRQRSERRCLSSSVAFSLRPSLVASTSSSSSAAVGMLLAKSSKRFKGSFRPFSTLPIASLSDDDDNDDEILVDLLDDDDDPPETDESVNQHQISERLFKVTAKFAPMGDQPQAIEQLTAQLEAGDKFSILQGITGTGKTLVMSHLIANANRPCLVLCHNKTLAAQTCRELKSFLKHNAVELFVSYYNHYVPESFVETTGKYIAKKSSVNAEIDALRHRATRALLTRSDVVVVASVSCIYGMGMPREYLDNSMRLEQGAIVSWKEFSNKLETMLYDVSIDDETFARGQYQLQQDVSGRKTIVLWPPHERFPMQIQLEQVSPENNDTLHVAVIRAGTQSGFSPLASTHIFPAKHHVVSEDRLEEACLSIEEELRDRVQELKAEGKHIEMERLQQRVVNDLMMLRETGFCSGGENYSRHLANRRAGEPPDTLMDYLGLAGQRDWLLMIDESHVTMPQLRAMYAGDQARKRRLVKHGYRLPSALDNRPLQAVEFWDQVQQTVLVSATPARSELELSERDPVEMVIRPTYVCDPVIEVRPSEGQLEDLRKEVQKRASVQQRTLAVALTKRDAEDLSSYLNEHGTKSAFIHSGLTTHERSDALKALQSGEVDCLVGVNLLREGLDLPQVSLVAILGADCEGFLRCKTSLLQTIGRAARNVDGYAIFYANRVTDSMRRCMDDTKKRRKKQLEYNARHGCEMRSTKGSSTMSIFDLSKDEIDAEMALETIGRDGKVSTNTSPHLDSIANLDIQSTSLELQSKSPSSLSTSAVTTDHVPASPGCYFWKDHNGEILYIGKAAKLRSRVKSYLSSKASHSARIKVMMRKAASVDFVLTPSERDALVLESNLIKHHQPPFNVLLKDDEHYPYICASCGDKYPRLFIAPRKDESMTASGRYRYYGPYTSFNEINAILSGVEEKYDLRAKSFMARHGSGSAREYKELFEKVLLEVFGKGQRGRSSLKKLRSEYEEAGLLFDSKFNQCRDVVVVVGQAENEKSEPVFHVLVLQLREGMVAGRFSYSCQLPIGITHDEDYGDFVHTVLSSRHYPAGENTTSSQFSWFPDNVLLSHAPADVKGLQNAIQRSRGKTDKKKKTITVGTAAKCGKRKEADARALEFAFQNAQEVAFQRSVGDQNIAVQDGTAAKELASLLSLEKVPSHIECYDVSHTQGEYKVASRVVFIDNKPAKHLYRKFNIKTVDGVDDYASLEETLHRRFRRSNGAGLQTDDETAASKDPWGLPDLVLIDGGSGQLGAAIKGMAKANVVPFSSSDSPIEGQSRVGLCAIAKNPDRIFVQGKEGPLNESDDSPALLLLRCLRDEAHRFALTAHRKRRSVKKAR